MNTGSKVLIAGVMLATGAMVYLTMQPPAEVNETSVSLRPSTRLVDETGGAQGLGAGERPWANQYDDKGELAYRFRAGQYNPLDSGTVGVDSPTFEFYLAGGRRVLLRGQTGKVFLPRRSTGGNTPGISGNTSSAGVPTRGTMKDVQIELFEGDEGAPALVAMMDNVVFDNDTLRIWTDDAVVAGVNLPGSKIPVTIRGNDYDFDGEGLTIQLANPGDRRIQRLEVARATRLVIKSTDLLQAPIGRVEVDAPAHRAAARPVPTPDSPLDRMLASTDPAAAVGAQASTPRPAASDVIYRATLRNGLRIQQGTDTSITGDLMQIDFSSIPRARVKQSASATPPNSPAAGNVAPSTAADPAPAPPVQAAAAPTSPPPAAPTPATRRDTQPIVVTWDGPLRVEADAGDSRVPPGEAVASVFGNASSPAVLRQGNSSANAPAIYYETASRLATLQGSDRAPVVLTDDRGSVVTTPLLKYDLPGRVVRMVGNSEVRAPVETDPQGNPKVLVATWTRDAEFRFAASESSPGLGGAVGGAAGGLASAVAGNAAGGNTARGGGRIESAVLAGGVKVEHPQLRMTSDRLSLAFDPAGRRGESSRKPESQADASLGGVDLREVVAEGNVVAMVDEAASDTAGSRQGIRGDFLRLTTARDASGRLYTDRLETSGRVVATDGKQELQSRGLAIVMVPDDTAKQRSARGLATGKPQTLSASGDVVARSDDGSVVKAQSLTVGNLSGERVVFIEGPGASVSGQGSTLTADKIVYSEATGAADITGKGRLAGVQKADSPNGRDTPFTVSWTDSAQLRAADNRIDLTGGIEFETADSEGGIATARSKSMRVTLADVQKPAADGARRGSSQAPPVRMLGEKSMRSVELAGDVRLQSVLGDASGKAVRQFDLFSEALVYGDGGGFSVPGAGRLLLIDRRVEGPGRRPEAPAPGQPALPSGRGNTAMKWDKSLTYDPSARTLVFDGGVVFVHDPLSATETPVPATERFRLDADRMVATLAGGSRSGATPDLGAEQIQSVSATGEVSFAGRGVTVWASELDLDPTGQIVVARGRDRLPVRVDDSRGAGTGTFTLARINLKSGQIEELQNPTGNVGLGGIGLPGTRPAR